jgi:ribosomal protein L14E/L6E/L27E
MELGQVVLSKCGRDKDNNFVVISIDDNNRYVYLADGLLRKIERPKKKKAKHVAPLHVDKVLSEKLAAGVRISNTEIKKCLNGFKQQNESGSFANSLTQKEGG